MLGSNLARGTNAAGLVLVPAGVASLWLELLVS